MTFANLTGEKNSVTLYRVVDLDLRVEGETREDTDFVEPDLLLLGDSHLLMAEIKTKAANVTRSRLYPLNQLLNYMKLVAECQLSDDPKLPDRFTHLILVPTNHLQWLIDHDQWVENSRSSGDGRLLLKCSGCWRFVKELPRKYRETIPSLLVQVPIYYRAWSDLTDSFYNAIRQFNDERNEEHWQKIAKELRALSDMAAKYA